MEKQAYVAYAATGWELDVEAALSNAGFETWIGRTKVEQIASKAKRKGPRIECIERPSLPNYFRLDLDDAEFYDVHRGGLYTPDGRNVRQYLYKSMMTLTRKGVQEFEAFQRKIEQMGVISELEAGRMIELVGGPFAGQLAVFRRICEGGNAVEFEMDLMGRIVSGKAKAEQIKAAE